MQALIFIPQLNTLKRAKIRFVLGLWLASVLIGCSTGYPADGGGVVTINREKMASNQSQTDEKVENKSTANMQKHSDKATDEKSTLINDEKSQSEMPALKSSPSKLNKTDAANLNDPSCDMKSLKKDNGMRVKVPKHCFYYAY